MRVLEFRPVCGDWLAARIESRVFVPYSGPAAKSAFWPSLSGMITL